MTRSLAVDSSNDIYIGTDGSLAIAAARDAVLHLCAQAAKAQLGEMVFAADQGMPNFEVIWAGVPNASQFEAYLRRNIEAVPDVIGIESVTITSSGGTLSYVATIKTIYGPGTIQNGV